MSKSRTYVTGLPPAMCPGACERGSHTGNLQGLGRQYQRGRGVNAYKLKHNRRNAIRVAVAELMRDRDDEHVQARAIDLVAGELVQRLDLNIGAARLRAQDMLLCAFEGASA